jgi:hypothetical protein
MGSSLARDGRNENTAEHDVRVDDTGSGTARMDEALRVFWSRDSKSATRHLGVVIVSSAYKCSNSLVVRLISSLNRHSDF